MPLYIKNNKLVQNKVLYKTVTINPSVIPNHINTSFASRLVGKNPSTDKAVYSVQQPFNGDGVFVRNSSCWINGITNISCFSPAQYSYQLDNWYNGAGTLLTKKHVLFAKHYTPPIISGGTPLIFVDDNSNVIRRKITSISNHSSSDIAIGLLDNEVPDNIKIAKVLPTNYNNYFNLTVGSPNISSLALDQQEKAIAKNCYSVFGDIISFNAYSDSSWTETIIGGDSGNPVFFIIDNELVVLTTWYTASYGPFVTYFYNDINTIINSLSPGGGYSLTPINLDLVYHKYK